MPRSRNQAETTFADILLRHAEEAVRFHGRMSGKVALREAFVRDWIAVKLHRGPNKCGVNLEVRNDEFDGFLRDPNLPEPIEVQEAYNALPLKSRRHFLDMVVFLDGRIHAIIELKMKRYVKEDIERTAKLQSIFKRTVLGFEVICIVGGRDGIDKEIGRLQGVLNNLGTTCGPLQRGAIFEAGDDKGCCCICVVPVEQAA